MLVDRTRGSSFIQNFRKKQSACGFQLSIESEVQYVFMYLFSLSNFQQRLLLHRIGTGMGYIFPVRSSSGWRGKWQWLKDYIEVCQIMHFITVFLTLC
jgi:hypothetical protein